MHIRDYNTVSMEEKQNRRSGDLAIEIVRVNVKPVLDADTFTAYRALKRSRQQQHSSCS